MSVLFYSRLSSQCFFALKYLLGHVSRDEQVTLELLRVTIQAVH